MPPSRPEAGTKSAWRSRRPDLNCRRWPSVRRSPSARQVLIASWRVSLRRRDADGLDHVAQITRGVPERLHRLHLAGIAGRPHLQLVLAGGQRDWHLPFAEGVFPEIGAELGLRPGLSLIGGDGNILDALAAIESNAFKNDRCASLQLRAVRDTGDE